MGNRQDYNQKNTDRNNNRNSFVHDLEEGRNITYENVDHQNFEVGEGQQQDTPQTNYLVFQMIILYGIWCGLQYSITTVFPFWVLSSWKSGGLGISIHEFSILTASGGIIFLLLALFGPFQLLKSASRTPLRSFRVGSGLLVIVILLLSIQLPYHEIQGITSQENNIYNIHHHTTTTTAAVTATNKSNPSLGSHFISVVLTLAAYTYYLSLFVLGVS